MALPPPVRRPAPRPPAAGTAGPGAQLHRNAAAWYEEHGLADDAIGHAVAAGEMLWAARIIEQHFDEVFNLRGEAATIHRWLSVLPAEVVRSRPRLLLAQALMAATSGHLEVVEPLLDAVECAPPGWADEPFEPTAGVGGQPPDQCPGPDHAPPRRSGPAPWRRRGHSRVRHADAGRDQARRTDAERHRARIPGRGRMAARPAHRGRTRLRVQRHRVARDQPAHADRVGLL